jgi:hypothetical protein
MLATKGSCEELFLASKRENCATPGGMIYTHLRNGSVLITIGTDDGRAIAFIGEKDSQPQLEVYWLYLSRIRIGSRGSEHILDVAGQCIIHMTRDGLVWSQVDCNATDENSARYRLLFRSDGRPVQVQMGRHRPAASGVNYAEVRRGYEVVAACNRIRDFPTELRCLMQTEETLMRAADTSESVKLGALFSLWINNSAEEDAFRAEKQTAMADQSFAIGKLHYEEGLRVARTLGVSFPSVCAIVNWNCDSVARLFDRWRSRVGH